MMKVIALTGSIATGKSTVAKMFEDFGAVVLDADTLAHETYAPGTALHKEIQKRYDMDLMDADQQINRKALAKILFENPNEKQWLETQIHPLTRAKIRERLQELQAQIPSPPLVLVEAALHVETGYYKEFESLIVVHADPDIQLRRLMKRDHLSQKEAKIRLANQIPSQEKQKYADWIIDNSGTLENTKGQIKKLYAQMLA